MAQVKATGWSAAPALTVEAPVNESAPEVATDMVACTDPVPACSMSTPQVVVAVPLKPVYAPTISSAEAIDWPDLRRNAGAARTSPPPPHRHHHRQTYRQLRRKAIHHDGHDEGHNVLEVLLYTRMALVFPSPRMRRASTLPWNLEEAVGVTAVIITPTCTKDGQGARQGVSAHMSH